MRLGQIKRNLGVEPSKVVAFLESKNVTITKHPNSKVTGEQLAWIMNEFKPTPTKEEKIKKAEIEKVETEKATEVEIVEVEVKKKKKTTPKKTTPKKKKEEPAIGEVIDLPKEPIKEVNSEVEEEIEVIRAPKVEIGGIKVLGKIDLPKPKVLEVIEEEKTEEEEEIVEPVEVDPMAHIHPSKRAKTKAVEAVKNLPKPKKITNKARLNEAAPKHKKAKEIKAEKNIPKGKKKKQLEKVAKLKSAKKAREEQEYVKKHGAPKKKKKSAQRIEVRSDGSIIPKHEQKQIEEPKEGLFSRFWKWFNS